MPAPRVAFQRGLLIAALIGYGIALVLVLLAFTVVDGEAGEWLVKVGFYAAVSATGIHLGSMRKRRG